MIITSSLSLNRALKPRALNTSEFPTPEKGHELNGSTQHFLPTAICGTLNCYREAQESGWAVSL